jgi:hypothetical protein
MRSHKLFAAAGIGVALGAAGTGIAACTSSSAPSGGNSSSGSSSPNGVTCATPNGLAISFNPMYSAYVTDKPHTFQIPAVVAAGNATWTASDMTAVSFQPNADLTMGGYTGTTITVLAAPSTPVTIVAQAGGLCGSAPLSITSATEADWQIGNARYNNGMSLHVPMFGGRGGEGGAGPALDGGSPFDMGDSGPACTSCHGATATSNIFTDVSHTPEQTGGFSDDDLLTIVLHGMVPDGGYFDPIVTPMLWHTIHQWADITPDQQKGIVVYLRSLPPAAQAGGVNIGGFRRGDGGRPMGGGNPSEAGSPAQDAGGSTTDATGSAVDATTTD